MPFAAQLAVSVVLTILSLQRIQGGTPSINFHSLAVNLPLPADIAVESPACGGCLPPRESIHCDVWTVPHPLVHAMAATKWAGSPPMYIAVGGSEMMIHMARVVAQTAARQGVVVVWEEYELMPHNFPMLLERWPYAKRCMITWAPACLQLVSGDLRRNETRGIVYPFDVDKVGVRHVRSCDINHLTSLTHEDVKIILDAALVRIESQSREFIQKHSSKL